jgi:hypothetical protein
MTGGEGIRIERNPFQADQATADRARVVEQASMDFAQHEEFQPPAASKIRGAFSEASRAEADYIIVPVVTA